MRRSSTSSTPGSTSSSTWTCTAGASGWPELLVDFMQTTVVFNFYDFGTFTTAAGREWSGPGSRLTPRRRRMGGQGGPSRPCSPSLPGQVHNAFRECSVQNLLFNFSPGQGTNTAFQQFQQRVTDVRGANCSLLCAFSALLLWLNILIQVDTNILGQPGERQVNNFVGNFYDSLTFYGRALAGWVPTHFFYIYTSHFE